MTLPYEWMPLGAKRIYDTAKLAQGTLVAWEHAVWRVIEVNRQEDTDEYAWAVVLRPAVLGDDPRARDADQHLGARAGTCVWHTYLDGHYPLCATCHEPLPCRDQMAAKIAAASAARFERYTMAGICPACEEVVTSRQRSHTWPDNAVVPGGPPVTFHLRGKCVGSARNYEDRWYALDPNARRRVMSCAGAITNHNDGTYECSEYPACPGPHAWHASYARCRCPDCYAKGSFGCYPTPNAKHVDRSSP